MERKQILEQLKNQFDTEFKNSGYKSEFEPDGYLTECNFGGLLIIIGTAGDSVLVWSDWSDNALSDKLTECEIIYENAEDENQELLSGFMYQDTFYRLAEFMQIDYAH